MSFFFDPPKLVLDTVSHLSGWAARLDNQAVTIAGSPLAYGVANSLSQDVPPSLHKPAAPGAAWARAAPGDGWRWLGFVTHL